MLLLYGRMSGYPVVSCHRSSTQRTNSSIEFFFSRGDFLILDTEIVESRQLFEPIAIMEHHQMFNPNISPYDICDRLGVLWKEVQKEAESNAFSLNADIILALNARVALALSSEPGDFANRDGWLEFLSELDEIGSLEEDDGHVYNWIFAELYWQHLTHCRFATTWILVNALNLQRGYEINRLSLENLGSFLDSLSGAGPPISDGQTFFAQSYS